MADVVKIVLLVDSIENDDYCRLVVQQILDVPPSSDIHLYINSGGGDVSTAWTIATALMQHGGNTVGIAAGDCFSAAVTILSACNRRYALPHSTFLIHRSVNCYGLSGRGTKFIGDHIKRQNAMDETVARFISHRTGIALDQMAFFFSQESYLTAAEAVGVGLVEWLPSKGPAFSVAIRAYTKALQSQPNSEDFADPQ